MTDMRLKPLSPNQRAIWGDCPVCKSSHGQPCIAAIVSDFEQDPPFVHMARLINAPKLIVEE